MWPERKRQGNMGSPEEKKKYGMRVNNVYTLLQICQQMNSINKISKEDVILKFISNRYQIIYLLQSHQTSVKNVIKLWGKICNNRAII